MNGDFRLRTELSDDKMEPIDKPMYNRLIRKAHAVRIDDSPYPRRNWRIEEITPEVLESAAPNPSTSAQSLAWRSCCKTNED